MCVLASPAVCAQEPPPAGEGGAVGLAPADLPVVEAEAAFRDRTWFTDRVATTLVTLPEVVEQPEELPDGGDGVAIAGVEVKEAEEGSAVEIRWLPRSGGTGDLSLA